MRQISFLIVIMLMLIVSFATATTICTSIVNISTGQTIGFNLAGVSYDAVQNFISPSYTGLTINGVSYTFYPNMPQTISQSTGSYAELTQINYVPIQSSDNFILCSAPQSANTQYNFNLSANSYGDLYFTYYGTKLIVGYNPEGTQNTAGFPTNVTMTNVTTSSPQPPLGYVTLTALSFSITTTAATTINLTQSIPCSLSPSKVAVYSLTGGSWVLVQGYSVNSTACTVTASLPGDIVGVFYYSPSAQTSSSSSSSTSTTASSSTTVYTTTSTASSSTVSSSVSTTTVPPPTTTVQPKTTTVPASGANLNQGLTVYAAATAIFILVAALAYWLISRSSRPFANKRKREYKNRKKQAP